jgi:hypothetical protein
MTTCFSLKKTTRDANALREVVEKVKFTLEQATKAPALDGVSGELCVSAVFPREKSCTQCVGGRVGPKPVLTCAENLTLTGIR